MPDPMVDSIAALSQYFVGDSSMQQTLDRVCDAALRAVPPAHYCGISMIVEGKPGTYVFSHPEVPEVDRPQYETGDGPCVEAFRTGERVMLRSTDEPTDFPDFCAVARRHGIHSVLSTPMQAVDDTVGAFNLYSTLVDGFDDDLLPVADAFATQAAFLLVNAQAYWDARVLSENLTEAMASRAEIEQAKGIIMGTMGIGPDEAFAVLREQSQHENVKLRDIAREVVRRAGGPAR
jgi:GAF domain-containing protein